MLKKEITFIYMDTAEQQIYKPIAEEAERRGYNVRLTDDKFAECEIGFYCQHVNFPQYSKFSFIMLHDITQQHGNWPDIWLREPWNKYDVGFLPDQQWIDNWNKCSQYYYANPRRGVYKIGWPKADNYSGIDRDSYKKEFNKRFGLRDDLITVLYAPSWENDGKQDDFVQAMLKLNVNIIIKQSNVTPDLFPDMYKAVQEMNALHKNIERVHIIDPKTNIFEVIMGSDILVSEESSTMCEATMMGVPAVAVDNWPIPDVRPCRMPECDYDFVFRTKKEQLSEFIDNMINNYDKYRTKTIQYSRAVFGEVGQSSKIIMDIVDDFVAGMTIRYTALNPKHRIRLSFRHYLQHRKIQIERAIWFNYSKRAPVFKEIYSLAKIVKHAIKK